ncbi:PEP-CTERM sorting domain-containing protein [Planctomycetaceae bacterium SH139]
MKSFGLKFSCFGVLAASLMMGQNHCRAEILTIQQQIQADFVFTATAAGEALLGAPEGVPLDMRALGSMTFSLDDTGGSTVSFTNSTGQLAGVTPPTDPGFLPFYITPVRFDGGELTNITRDTEGRIISGTVEDLAMPWEMIGTGANAGLVLYGDQETTPLLFSGAVNVSYDSGAPKFMVGDMLSGLEDFNIYLFDSGDRENQLPGTDPLVFVGSSRFLTAVPEPSSVGLGIAAVGLAVGRRLRKGRSSAKQASAA